MQIAKGRAHLNNSSAGEAQYLQIKCDETKPSCLRCREKGLKCSGVATGPKIRWSSKHESYHPQTAAVSRKEDDAINRNLKAAWKSFFASQTPRLGADTDVDCSGDEFTDTQAMEARPDRGGHELTEELGIIAGNQILSVKSPTQDCAARGSVSMGCTPGNPIALSPIIHSSPTLLQPYIEEPDPAGLGDLSPYPEQQHETEDQTADGTGFPRFLLHTPTPSRAPSQTFRDNGPPLNASLVDIQSELIVCYFNIVCPIFSTFDSQHNLFRSFVSERWQNSATMFYAISSMAAAKISRELPTMKSHALAYQSLAISHLHADVSQAVCWDEELLFVVLMLGLSTSWHVVTDLGITHLKAMQQAIAESTFQQTCDGQILQFAKEALVYWEMVICSVNDDIVIHESRTLGSPSPAPALTPHHDSLAIIPDSPFIMPHPWAGVAAGPQGLFARVARRIRQARSFGRDGQRSTSKTDIICPEEFLEALDTLEDQIWRSRLPALHEIANTGDQNTPAIHHLLLAEAYMFATMYQLYHTFPYLWRRRSRSLRDIYLKESHPVGSWAHDQAKAWSNLLRSSWSTELWVRFLGRNVILRLEQIQGTSGTCCVHALLLLVGSSSLSVVPELEGDDASEVLRARGFVLDRLSQVSASKLSEPLSQIESVVLRIFRCLDLGLDVFWMDTMDAMGVVTIIG